MTIDFGTDFNASDHTVIVHRVQPAPGGYLGRHRFPMTLEDLRRRYGGGEFRLVVSGPDTHNPQKNVLKAQRRVQISGPPEDSAHNGARMLELVGDLQTLLERSPVGERVAALRALGTILRVYVPEVADELESYGSY